MIYETELDINEVQYHCLFKCAYTTDFHGYIEEFALDSVKIEVQDGIWAELHSDHFALVEKDLIDTITDMIGCGA